jgi:hypothetical protein
MYGREPFQLSQPSQQFVPDEVCLRFELFNPGKLRALVERDRRQAWDVQLVAVHVIGLRLLRHDRCRLAPALRQGRRQPLAQGTCLLSEICAVSGRVLLRDNPGMLQLCPQALRPMRLRRRDLQRIPVRHGGNRRTAEALEPVGLRQQSGQVIRIHSKGRLDRLTLPRGIALRAIGRRERHEQQQVGRCLAPRGAQPFDGFAGIASLQGMKAESEQRLGIAWVALVDLVPRAFRLLEAAGIRQLTGSLD